MIYVLAQYWPFIIAAFVIGIPFGWVFHAPAGRRPSTEGDER
jgi:hypothetical protein